MKWRWYALFPGDAYALGPTGQRYGSERAARAAFREIMGYDRLPRGTQVWKA